MFILKQNTITKKYLTNPVLFPNPPIVPPKIAPFTFGEESMSFGDIVSAQCTIAGGDLPVSVTWLLNGAPIEPQLQILQEMRGKRIYILTIDSVSEKHVGNYTCFAKNRAGHANHSSELKVNGLYKVYNVN